MTIAAPVLAGTATGPRSSPLTLTPLVPVAAGSAIILGTDADMPPAYPASVTDTAGNTYQQLPGAQGSLDPYVSMWAAYNVAALTTSSTITITYPVNGTRTVSAIAIAVPSGLAPGNPADQTASDWTTGTSMVFTTPGQLAVSGELRVAYWSARVAQGAPLPPSDWNSVAAFQAAASNHWVNMAWRISQATSRVVVRASTPSAGAGWTGVVATFKPAFAPSAAMGCGGTMTPWHVSQAAGTAVLGCAGSILGPAETAPVPPPAQPVFPAGYGPLAADFRNWVQQAFSYASTGIVFRAEQHTAQPLPAGTFTPLAFDAIIEDPWKGWSGSVTTVQAPDSWLVPWTGVYRITFRYACASSSNHKNNPAVGVNSGSPAWEAGGAPGSGGNLGTGGGGGDASVLLPLLAGDWVQLLAWCDVATSTDVSAAGRYASCEITAVQTDVQDIVSSGVTTPVTPDGYPAAYGPVY